MIDALIAVVAIMGGLSVIFAVLAWLADSILDKFNFGISDCEKSKDVR